jgi:glycosyltransferase involved in cell wall biosynthesis
MLTIFHRAEEHHLYKDVGMVSEYLSKRFSEENILLTENYIANSDFLTNTTVHKIAKISFFNLNISLFWFLVKYASNHNYLITYHLRYYSVIYAIFYRLLNKKGKIYFKSDKGDLDLAKSGSFVSGLSGLITKLLFIFLRLLGPVNLSFETHLGLKYAKEKNPWLLSNVNLFVLHNGVDFPINLEIDDKEKIGLCVGRLGAEEKNFELVLSVLQRFYKEDSKKYWKFYFIGDYTQEFYSTYRDLCIQDEVFAKNVKLTGSVSNKSLLTDYYKRAKIVMVPSIREGFPLVYSESAFFGCVTISTPVSSSFEFLSDKGFVSESFTKASYYKVFQEVLANDALISKMSKEMLSRRDKLLWSNLIEDVVLL